LSGWPRQRLAFGLGPFDIALSTDCPELLSQWRYFYDGLPQAGDGIHDFHLSVLRPLSHRRWFRPQAVFRLNRYSPFEPFPRHQAFPLLEWGINWVVASRAHDHLLLHSAALERTGKALILPALPGSGKSTLCAALALRGWRLLSDEFGMLHGQSGEVRPLPKAVVLKNASIDIIRRFEPGARIGPLFPGTRKGTVAHLATAAGCLARHREPAEPGWVVFPQYQAGVDTRLEPLPKGAAFVRLANNSFNYRLKEAEGFVALRDLIRRSDCYTLQFDSLTHAVTALDSLLP
jgi:HprK-related kinase A